MPRIYAASLTDYNDGRLTGRWIDVAGMDADDIGAEVQAMLTAAGPGREEWAIHDFEDFDPFTLSEWASFQTIATMTDLLDNFPSEVLGHAAGRGVDPAEMADWLTAHYAGEFADTETWAGELLMLSAILDRITDIKVPTSRSDYFTLPVKIDWSGFRLSAANSAPGIEECASAGGGVHVFVGS